MFPMHSQGKQKHDYSGNCQLPSESWPKRLPCTTVTSPALMAFTVTIISTAFPKVAFNKPPILNGDGPLSVALQDWKWEIRWIHLGDAENGRCNDKEHVTIATMSWKNSFTTSDIFRQGTFAQCGQPSILWRLPGWLLRVQLPQSCKKTEPPHSLERNQGMIHRDPRISCAAAVAHLKSVQKSWWICATEKIGISMDSVPSTSKVPFLHVAINAQGHKD